MITITGDIKSIERNCCEIAPVADDKGNLWKQYETDARWIVVRGKNLKAKETDDK